MKSLGADLVRAAGGRPIPERVSIHDWPLERIHKLPHTVRLLAEIAAMGAMGELHDQGFGQRIKALQAALEDAGERDRLAAQLPAGCSSFPMACGGVPGGRHR